MVYHIHEFTMKMVYVCLCPVLGELYSLAPQQLQYSPIAPSVPTISLLKYQWLYSMRYKVVPHCHS